jgi:hypothetical protein
MADAPADDCVTPYEIFWLLALQLSARDGLDGTPPAVASVLIAPPGEVPLPAAVEPFVRSAT